MKKPLSIVHIGLPKTGTTSLQKYVFPKICEKLNMLYNPKEISSICRNGLFYNNKEKNNLQNVLKHNNVFVSKETLVNWNPCNWESAADKVLELFGKKSIIIISLRNPYEYLNSIYIQKILHEGNIIPPSDFFPAPESNSQNQAQ